AQIKFVNMRADARIAIGKNAGMIRVEIYSKPGCHLCDEAKAVLERVRRSVPFDLTEINIEASPAHYEQFKEEIPVVFINGRKAFKFHVDEKALRRHLSS